MLMKSSSSHKTINNNKNNGFDLKVTKIPPLSNRPCYIGHLGEITKTDIFAHPITNECWVKKMFETKGWKEDFKQILPNMLLYTVALPDYDRELCIIKKGGYFDINEILVDFYKDLGIGDQVITTRVLPTKKVAEQQIGYTYQLTLLIKEVKDKGEAIRSADEDPWVEKMLGHKKRWKNKYQPILSANNIAILRIAPWLKSEGVVYYFCPNRKNYNTYKILYTIDSEIKLKLETYIGQIFHCKSIFKNRNFDAEIIEINYHYMLFALGENLKKEKIIESPKWFIDLLKQKEYSSKIEQNFVAWQFKLSKNDNNSLVTVIGLRNIRANEFLYYLKTINEHYQNLIQGQIVKGQNLITRRKYNITIDYTFKLLDLIKQTQKERTLILFDPKNEWITDIIDTWPWRITYSTLLRNEKTMLIQFTVKNKIAYAFIDTEKVIRCNFLNLYEYIIKLYESISNDNNIFKCTPNTKITINPLVPLGTYTITSRRQLEICNNNDFLTKEFLDSDICKITR